MTLPYDPICHTIPDPFGVTYPLLRVEVLRVSVCLYLSTNVICDCCIKIFVDRLNISASTVLSEESLRPNRL